MRHPDEKVHLNEEDASGGQKGTGMRYVLIVSTFLAIVMLSLIWIIPATTR